MKAEDVAWVVLLSLAAGSFGMLCLLASSCAVYEETCAQKRERSAETEGVIVCLDEPVPHEQELAGDPEQRIAVGVADEPCGSDAGL